MEALVTQLTAALAERDHAIAVARELQNELARKDEEIAGLWRQKEADCYQLNDLHAENERLRSREHLLGEVAGRPLPGRNLLTVAPTTHLLGGDQAR